MRWPCSQNRFPTMRGKTCPFESGQSDVAKPASWLVTNAPAIIKNNVAQATSKHKQLHTQPNRSWSNATFFITTLSPLGLICRPFAIDPKTFTQKLFEYLARATLRKFI